MEICSDLRIKELVKNIHRLLLGVEKGSDGNSSIVKINSDNLSKYGDVCFLTKLETWRKVYPDNFESVSSSGNILEHYLTRNGIEFEYEDVTDKAFRNIIQASRNWCLKIEKCILQNERVCLFLDRRYTLAKTVETIVARDVGYGEFEAKNKTFCFNVVYDKDSELTNLRLRLIKSVADNIIKTHGYKVSDNIIADKYDITTKSKTGSKDQSKIILCGVAKNSTTKTKETNITEIQYCDEKLAELFDATEHKLISPDGQTKDKSSGLKRIAEAAVAIEFLAVKPSRAITITSGLDNANAKGSSFVLYNTARISAIFDRFEEECSKGNYPSLPELGKVDFSLLNQEEEWELAYNFLLGYPETIETCLRLEEGLEICPQYICSFLSRFCNKFSAYYRRVRILTEGRDHLLPTMMARLYLLKAIQIVIHNALRLLNIDPVSRM